MSNNGKFNWNTGLALVLACMAFIGIFIYSDMESARLEDRKQAAYDACMADSGSSIGCAYTEWSTK